MRIGLKFECFAGCLLPAALTLMPSSVWSLQHTKFLSCFSVHFAFVGYVRTKDRQIPKYFIWKSFNRKLIVRTILHSNMKAEMLKVLRSLLWPQPCFIKVPYYYAKNKLFILLKVWSSHDKGHVNTFSL